MVPTMFWPLAKSGLFPYAASCAWHGGHHPAPERGGRRTWAVRHAPARRECLEKIAEPLVAGIHTSNPENMSVMATFPRFVQMEQKSGSLILGMLAALKSRPHATLSGPSRPRRNSPSMTYFMSFKNGMQTLPQACADFIGKDSIRLGAAVRAVEPRGKDMPSSSRTARSSKRTTSCSAPHPTTRLKCSGTLTPTSPRR